MDKVSLGLSVMAYIAFYLDKRLQLMSKARTGIYGPSPPTSSNTESICTVRNRQSLRDGP